MTDDGGDGGAASFLNEHSLSIFFSLAKRDERCLMNKVNN